MTAGGAAAQQTTISVNTLRVPEKSRDDLRKACAKIAKRDVAGALKDLNSSLERAPEFADALTVRGLVRLQMGEMDDAKADLERALEIDPEQADASLNLGTVYNHLGRYDDAMRMLARAETHRANSWQCAYQMAQALLGKQDYAAALEAVNRAASLGGEKQLTAPLHFVRATALAGLKQYPEATEEAEAFLTQQPNGPLAELAKSLLQRIASVQRPGQEGSVAAALTIH
jgi:tetratricopeptide (TPR) repeat protein